MMLLLLLLLKSLNKLLQDDWQGWEWKEQVTEMRVKRKLTKMATASDKRHSRMRP